MPFRIDIRLSGDASAARRLHRLAEATKDVRPSLKRIIAHWHTYMETVFATEGGTTKGGRWVPLSPSYAAWKAEHYPGGGILTRTGRLRASFTGGFGGFTITEPGGRLIMGSAIEDEKGGNLAARHQTGDGPPVRKIIDPPDSVYAEWSQIIREDLLRAGGL